MNVTEAHKGNYTCRTSYTLLGKQYHISRVIKLLTLGESQLCPKTSHPGRPRDQDSIIICMSMEELKPWEAGWLAKSHLVLTFVAKYYVNGFLPASDEVLIKQMIWARFPADQGGSVFGMADDGSFWELHKSYMITVTRGGLTVKGVSTANHAGTGTGGRVPGQRPRTRPPDLQRSFLTSIILYFFKVYYFVESELIPTSISES